MSHTIGPWEYDPKAEQIIAPKCGYHGAAGYAVVADMRILPYDETPANGRLLGSALRMLATLRECLEFVEDQEDVVDGPNGEQQPNDAMMLALQLRTIIRAATGERP